MRERPGSVRRRDFEDHGNNCITVIIGNYPCDSYLVISNSS